MTLLETAIEKSSRQPRLGVCRGGRRIAYQRAGDRRRRGAFKGSTTGDHLVQNSTERKQIGPLVDRQPLDLLG